MNKINRNHSALYWEKLDNDKVRCTLCPRHCILSDGQSGFCFIRKNISGEMVATAYGKASGFCIDPIEKKPLNHFYPGTTILSFGTQGCNMGCNFCQNWHLSKSSDDRVGYDKAEPKLIAQTAKDNGCHSVAFTYNEPIIFFEYATNTAIECHKLGIKTVAVTAGYICNDPRQEFFKHMDAANIDLKAITPDFYKKHVNADITKVLDTLIYVKKETNTWLEITNLIIPNENDSLAEIEEMCDWILKNLGNDVPIHFSAFHPAYKFNGYPATKPETLIHARKIALAKGIKYVFTGNIYDSEGQNTYCANCKAALIIRQGFRIAENNLINTNQCPKCGTECEGHFKL